MRPSFVERDAFRTALSNAFADGRIDDEEFERRSTLIETGSRASDLQKALEDLPRPEVEFPDHPHPRRGDQTSAAEGTEGLPETQPATAAGRRRCGPRIRRRRRTRRTLRRGPSRCGVRGSGGARSRFHRRPRCPRSRAQEHRGQGVHPFHTGIHRPGCVRSQGPQPEDLERGRQPHRLRGRGPQDRRCRSSLEGHRPLHARRVRCRPHPGDVAGGAEGARRSDDRQGRAERRARTARAGRGRRTGCGAGDHRDRRRRRIRQERGLPALDRRRAGTHLDLSVGRRLKGAERHR
ncbi:MULTISPECIES: DUF1707 SHOCT-like domain-containing protein [unclassified Brevibacterium]|uniref:DUF1707 SHOCT-like domain-containing protein n=1 Tax=unclassified Brevibacterium TaxID=2614124 RepID=UPI00109189C4|nr:DUF1707 domain-containing protein [Brevibacterium sp. S22]